MGWNVEKKKKKWKKKQRKTTWENFARVASGIVFCGCVLVTKLPGTHLTIGRPSRIPWGYPSLYSTIYFEQLQLNQRLLCNGNWEGAISAVKIYSFFDWRAVFFFQLVYSPDQARVSQNFRRVFAPGKCFFLSIFNYLGEFLCKVGQHTSRSCTALQFSHLNFVKNRISGK